MQVSDCRIACSGEACHALHACTKSCCCIINKPNIYNQKTAISELQIPACMQISTCACKFQIKSEIVHNACKGMAGFDIRMVVHNANIFTLLTLITCA